MMPEITWLTSLPGIVKTFIFPENYEKLMAAVTALARIAMLADAYEIEHPQSRKETLEVLTEHDEAIEIMSLLLMIKHSQLLEEFTADMIGSRN